MSSWQKDTPETRIKLLFQGLCYYKLNQTAVY
jgi:hypothetical protein